VNDYQKEIIYKHILLPFCIKTVESDVQEISNNNLYFNDVFLKSMIDIKKSLVEDYRDNENELKSERIKVNKPVRIGSVLIYSIYKSSGDSIPDQIFSVDKLIMLSKERMKTYTNNPEFEYKNESKVPWK
jgi:cytochrome c biogenesis protein ResB